LYVTLPRVGTVRCYSVHVRMKNIIRVPCDIYVTLFSGHAIEQAASCRLFTAETRLHLKDSSRSGTATVFIFLVLRLSQQLLFHQCHISICLCPETR